jgi:hypothetical protein
VRDASEASQPCYLLQEILGARAGGWRGTGPVTVRLESGVARDETMSAEVVIPRGILVTLQPAAEAQVLARWTPGGTATPERDVVVLRLGNVVYTGLNLLAAPNDTPAVRRLFLWMFGFLAPNLAFEQAREQAAGAMAAAIKADAQVSQAEGQLPHVNFAPVRELLEGARDAAAQAKERVAQERYRESSTAVERSRMLLQQALQILAKLTNKTK